VGSSSPAKKKKREYHGGGYPAGKRNSDGVRQSNAERGVEQTPARRGGGLLTNTKEIDGISSKKKNWKKTIEQPK